VILKVTATLYPSESSGYFGIAGDSCRGCFINRPASARGLQERYSLHSRSGTCLAEPGASEGEPISAQESGNVGGQRHLLISAYRGDSADLELLE
jgi:hypothetical protein